MRRLLVGGYGEHGDTPTQIARTRSEHDHLHAQTTCHRFKHKHPSATTHHLRDCPAEMTRIGLPLGEEGRGRATNGHIFKRCHSSYTNGGSLIVLKLYAHAREGTNRREGTFATNHGKTQHQNTQNENTKSPPWVRSQSFIRSLYLCQYLYHNVRYLSSNVEIFCVRYLLHMSICISVSVLCDLYVYICLGGAALASIIFLKMCCYCI